MSASDKPLAPHVFTYHGGHCLRVECRRLPHEVSGVTQTLQLDVEELFANLLDWDSAPMLPPPWPAEAAAERGDEPQLQQQGQQQQQRPDSKKLCGNVAIDQPDLIGLDVWPAAVALCDYLACHPHLVEGAAVCELGAGMGLPGLLCAKLGASSVLLTDYEPLVVDCMRRNAQQNGLTPACSFLALDWFDFSQLAPAQHHVYDLLLLADVIYAAAVVQPLVCILLVLLRPGNGAALVAHRIRRPLIFDRVDKIARLQERDEIFEEFKAACQAAGLHLRVLNDSSAAQAGEEPLLLAIGPSLQQLQRFAALEPVHAAAAGAGDGSASAESAGAAASAPAAAADTTA